MSECSVVSRFHLDFSNSGRLGRGRNQYQGGRQKERGGRGGEGGEGRGGEGRGGVEQ